MDHEIIKSLRHSLAGALLLLMVVTTILAGLGLFRLAVDPLWVAGAAAWGAAALLFADTGRVLKVQVLLIVAIGLGLLLYARGAPSAADLGRALGVNTGILTMLAAVGFLRLVMIRDGDRDEALPVGPSAYLQTLIGLNVSSSIINISAPLLIADRIQRRRPLDRLSAQSFVRVFCGVSSWSPFYGAMAVALTQVADASLYWAIAAGLPFTLVGLLVVWIEARLRYADALREFVGYPMHAAALRFPVILIGLVPGLTWLLPSSPVLVLISLAALAVTAVALLASDGLPAGARQLGRHVVHGLPRLVNELCLFLAAGVLSTGISELVAQDMLANPFSRFDGQVATLLLALIVACAVIGIHPIVLISSLAPMMLALDADANLLAATFLFSWHLGTCASPLSGTNLTFQGRYGIAAWRLAWWNLPYALAMFGVAALWLPLLAHILP